MRIVSVLPSKGNKWKLSSSISRKAHAAAVAQCYYCRSCCCCCVGCPSIRGLHSEYQRRRKPSFLSSRSATAAGGDLLLFPIVPARLPHSQRRGKAAHMCYESVPPSFQPDNKSSETPQRFLNRRMQHLFFCDIEYLLIIFTKKQCKRGEMARAFCATKVCRLVAQGTLLSGAQTKMTNRRDSFLLQAAAKGGV